MGQVIQDRKAVPEVVIQIVGHLAASGPWIVCGLLPWKAGRE